MRGWCKVRELTIPRLQAIKLGKPDPEIHGNASAFQVTIRLHTEDARYHVDHDERVREIVATALESLDGVKLQEEIDFTLEVKRHYK
jgi:hypothetical protein